MLHSPLLIIATLFLFFSYSNASAYDDETKPLLERTDYEDDYKGPSSNLPKKAQKEQFLDFGRRHAVTNKLRFPRSARFASLRIATFNIEVFAQGFSKVADEIERINATVLFIQELPRRHRQAFIDRLRIYPFHTTCTSFRPNGVIYNAIFSKVPIRNPRTTWFYDFPIFTRCMVQADINVLKMHNDVTVMTAHLSNGESWVQKRARRRQLVRIRDAVRKSIADKKDVIVGADFNMVMEMFRMPFPGTRDLVSGVSKTPTQWRGKRIDYLYGSFKFSVRRSGTWYSDASDHWAQVVDLYIQRKKKIGHKRRRRHKK